MTDVACTTHPDRPALYRCDGCQRLLCADCSEEGHRLVFCRHCRERGLPLDPTLPNERARRQRDSRAAPYSLSDALRYPFRGSGSTVFWSFLAVLAVLSIVSVVPIVGAAAGCLGFVWLLLVLFVLPGAFMAIIRTTERGDDELPDWPDYSEFSLRLAEAFGFLLAATVALIPGLGLLQLAGCSMASLATGTAGPLCWLLFFTDLVLATILWIPAFGAVGVFDANFLAVRVDLHLRAVAAMGSDFWQVAALLAGLLVAGQAAALLLFTVPGLGLLFSSFAGLYTWFTGAHLIGLLFRRHHDAMEAIYWPRNQ